MKARPYIPFAAAVSVLSRRAACFIASAPSTWVSPGYQSVFLQPCRTFLAPETCTVIHQHSATMRSVGICAKRWHRDENKFHRFRVQMKTKVHGQNPRDSDDVLVVAQSAFAVLARKGRAWSRLGRLVEMACDNAEELRDEASGDLPSIADVGCDHGLLAIGLAASGSFQRVIGTDVSARALNGALTNYRNVMDVQVSESPELPVDFRVCDGLQCLEPGEADAICIAGMGISTMSKILFPSDDRGESLDLDRLKCQRLFLQPTNSKPRNLVRLYDQLQESGWGVKDESIVRISSRWYFSAAFALNEAPQPQLPGTILMDLPATDTMRRVYQNYVDHHTQWIERDKAKNGGNILQDEQRWLKIQQIL